MDLQEGIVRLLFKAALWITIFLIGYLVYRLGNRLLGKKSRGGRRFVIFITGLLLLILSLALGSKAYSELSFGAGIISLMFAIGALWCTIASLFCSNRKLDKIFDKIINAL